MQYYVEMSQNFSKKNLLLYFKCRKNLKRVEIQNETFRVAVLSQVAIM